MIESMSIIISTACNLNCPHCLSKSGVPSQSELSAEELIEYLKKIKRLMSLKITGGEPFNPYVKDKTYKIIDYCINNGINVQINTNGTYLIPDFNFPKERITFQVSLDGFREKHDAIRGNGVFDKTVEFIRTYRDKYKIIVTTVIMEQFDFDEILKFDHFIKYELNVENRYQIVSQVGRAVENCQEFTLTDEEFDNIVKKFDRYGMHCRERKSKCTNLLYDPLCLNLSIDAEGNIIPCPFLSQYKFGHIKDFNEEEVREKMQSIKGITCSYPNKI